jgi:hypothetical protein
MRRSTIGAVLMAALVILPGVQAQGCALCYTSASAAGAAAQHSLRVGILALMIPALAIFVGILFLLLRRARSAAA